MATKFGIRNYSRNGNVVTFTVYALSDDNSIDTAFAGTVTFAATNLSWLSSHTFMPGDAGGRVFTAMIDDPSLRASADAIFPGGTGTGASLVIGGPTGETVATAFTGEAIFVGGSGNDNYTGSSSDDLFRLDLGGNDIASGGAGNDGFYFAGAYTVADVVDGGAGKYDSIGLKGDYSGGVTLGSLLNTELVVLLDGVDGRFGPNGTYDYNITADANTLVSGNRLTIQANMLRSAEDFTFNGSASAIDFVIYAGFGVDNLTGGSGNDGFFFGQGRFSTSDVVNGGAGTMDQIGFQGRFLSSGAITFGATQISGIEAIVLLSAGDNRFGSGGGSVDYEVNMRDGNTAAGQRMLIQANTLQGAERLTFDGSLETDGSFQIFSGGGSDTLGGSQNADDLRSGAGADVLIGNGGADLLRGGSGNDTFFYRFASDSLPGARDQILDFALGDRIWIRDLAQNNGFSSFLYIGNNAQTGARQLQVIQSGTAATVNIFINADNIADLVIDLTVIDGHAITIADFNGATTFAEELKLSQDFVPVDEPMPMTRPIEWFDELLDAGGTRDLLI